MTDIERRVAPITLEVREDGRTLVGTAVPYGVETRIGSYMERFAFGAFSDADPEHVPLLAQHDHESLPVGRAIALTETPGGLEAEIRVSQTRAGDEVLELIRDKALSGLSVGFVPIQDAWNATRSAVTRVKARLVELSLTAWPAYEGARILAVRTEPLVRTYRLNLARWQG